MLAELLPFDIDARRTLAALGPDTEPGRIVDDTTLEGGHDVADSQCRTPQVHQWIDDELTGAVIGDLAATIDLHDGMLPGART